MAVHLRGCPCNMKAIMAMSEKYNIKVLEDCAQSPGATYKGKKLGSIGHIGIFSFNVFKLATAGEGGALVTNNRDWFLMAARYHDMGNLHRVFDENITTNQKPIFPGENYRMNEFTGAVLLAQLAKLDTMIADLRRMAGKIKDGIADLPGIQFRSCPDSKGDIQYGVYIKLKDAETCHMVIQECRVLKLPVVKVTSSVLLPVQESVVNKSTRHPLWPSFNTDEGKKIQYGEQSCRQTLEIYQRFLQINIGPGLTTENINYIIKNLREIYLKYN